MERTPSPVKCHRGRSSSPCRWNAERCPAGTRSSSRLPGSSVVSSLSPGVTSCWPCMVLGRLPPGRCQVPRWECTGEGKKGGSRRGSLHDPRQRLLGWGATPLCHLTLVRSRPVPAVGSMSPMQEVLPVCISQFLLDPPDPGGGNMGQHRGPAGKEFHTSCGALGTWGRAGGVLCEHRNKPRRKAGERQALRRSRAPAPP